MSQRWVRDIRKNLLYKVTWIDFLIWFNFHLRGCPHISPAFLQPFMIFLINFSFDPAGDLTCITTNYNSFHHSNHLAHVSCWSRFLSLTSHSGWTQQYMTHRIIVCVLLWHHQAMPLLQRSHTHTSAQHLLILWHVRCYLVIYITFACNIIIY